MNKVKTKYQMLITLALQIINLIYIYLQNMEQEEDDQQINPTTNINSETIHFYATSSQLRSRQMNNTYSLEEILQDGFQSEAHIYSIYSLINQQINQFKYITKREPIQKKNPEKYQQFLNIKYNIFAKYYGCEFFQKQPSMSQLLIFDVQVLLLFFKQILNIFQSVKQLIKRISGSNRKIKISCFCLLENVYQLLKQIEFASNPFALFQNRGNSIQVFSEFIYMQEIFKEYIQQEATRQKQFVLNDQKWMKSSILQIMDEIQSLNLQMSKQKKIIMTNNQMRESKIMIAEIDMVQKLINISKLKYIKLKHQILLFLGKFNTKAILQKNQYFTQLIKQDPLNKYQQQQLDQILFEMKQKRIPKEECFIFYRNIIQGLLSLKQKNVNNPTYQRSVMDLITIHEKWLKITKQSQTQLLLHQNYIALLRIYNQIDSTYIYIRQDSIHPHMVNYLTYMISYLINYHRKVMQKIIKFDEELTFRILISNKIVSTIKEFEKDVVELVKQLSPLMDIITDLQEMKEKKKQKNQYIKNILARVHYWSLNKLDSANILMTASKLKMDNVIYNIDVILSIQIDDSMQLIKPYLRQIKYMLMLLSVLRDTKGNVKNIGKTQQANYLKLQDIAEYFSKDRNLCPIYQIKAKIMLFITLFKMGYHIPMIQQNGTKVNLRNRIINLYSKLYSSHTGQNIFMLSRINSNAVSMFMTSTKSKESDIFYGHKQVEDNMFNQVQNDTDMIKEINLQISVETSQRIGEFINNHLKNSQNNCKLYLLNLLNVLQHELFLMERLTTNENQAVLSRHYIKHMKTCLNIQRTDILNNLNIIFQIQRLFYLQKYDIAWRVLLDQRRKNSQFNDLLDGQIKSVANSNQIFKFVKIISLFQRMSHLFFSKQSKEANIKMLTQLLNINTSYPISINSVEQLYQLFYQQKRMKLLEQFYQRRLLVDQQKKQEFVQFNSRLNQYKINVARQDKVNKNLIRIQIPNSFCDKFASIKTTLSKYYLFNEVGLFKINDIQCADSLKIQIESNKYRDIQKLKDNNAVVENKQQNQSEKICKNLIKNIIQVCDLFYDPAYPKSILKNQEIQINYEHLQYSINPFFILIERLVTESTQSNKNQQFATNIKIALLIQSVIKPLVVNFTLKFKQNYISLLQNIRLPVFKGNQKFKINKFLQCSLFTNIHQKQVFFIYFDNKMSEMCDKFHSEQYKFKIDKNFQELQKCLLNRMKDSLFKTFSYNFMVSGLTELQMRQLKICQGDQSQKLDWITAHKNLKIVYQIPRYDNDQIKQYAFSLNTFMKCVRGALAHKIQNNFNTILNILQEFPKLIDYLHTQKQYLSMKYEDLILMKNEWLRNYFETSQQKLTLLKETISKFDKNSFISDRTKQQLSLLNSYAIKYKQNLFKQAKQQRCRCDKCISMFAIIKKSHHLLDLFITFGKMSLSQIALMSNEHAHKDCFLIKQFKNHRKIKLFGGMGKRLQPKHFIIVSWWFYFEYTFPCLLMLLDRVRFLVQQIN